MEGVGGGGEKDGKRRRIGAAEIKRAYEITECQDEAEQRGDHEPHPGGGYDHFDDGAHPPAAQVVGGFNQRAIDEHQAEELQQNNQGEGQGHVTDHRAERRVQHSQRPDPDHAEDGVDESIVGTEDMPRVDTHQVRSEEHTSELQALKLYPYLHTLSRHAARPISSMMVRTRPQRRLWAASISVRSTNIRLKSCNRTTREKVKVM